MLVYVTVYDKTRHVGFFAKITIAIYINSTNLAPNLRPIASSVSEIQRPLHAIARTIELEKLRSKCVATHAHAASVYYECTKIDLGGASRSNETSEQIATRTAWLRP